jgi:hypothetical protein
MNNIKGEPAALPEMIASIIFFTGSIALSPVFLPFPPYEVP